MNSRQKEVLEQSLQDEQAVLDGAYTSFSLSEKLNFFTHYPVQFEVQLPKGTKGFITSNLDESEYIARKGSTIEIIGAEVYNDGAKDCIKIFGKMIQGE